VPVDVDKNGAFMFDRVVHWANLELVKLGASFNQ
jgi:hypothetical protein